MTRPLRASNLAPLTAGRAAAHTGSIPPAPAGAAAVEEPIFLALVAELGFEPAGLAWTPRLHQLVAEHAADGALVVVHEDTPTTPLTLRVPA